MKTAADRRRWDTLPWVSRPRCPKVDPWDSGTPSGETVPYAGHYIFIRIQNSSKYAGLQGSASVPKSVPHCPTAGQLLSHSLFSPRAGWDTWDALFPTRRAALTRCPKRAGRR